MASLAKGARAPKCDPTSFKAPKCASVAPNYEKIIPKTGKNKGNVVVSVMMPLLKSAGDVVLDVSDRTFVLTAPFPEGEGKYRLDFKLEEIVDPNCAAAKWSKRKSTLVVALPIVKDPESAAVEEDPIEEAFLTSPLSSVDVSQDGRGLVGTPSEAVAGAVAPAKDDGAIGGRKLVYDETFGVIDKSILVQWEKSNSPSKTPGKKRALPPVRNSPRNNIVNSPSDEFCVSFGSEENMPTVASMEIDDDDSPDNEPTENAGDAAGKRKKKKKKKPRSRRRTDTEGSFSEDGGEGRLPVSPTMVRAEKDSEPGTDALNSTPPFTIPPTILSPSEVERQETSRMMVNLDGSIVAQGNNSTAASSLESSESAKIPKGTPKPTSKNKKKKRGKKKGGGAKKNQEGSKQEEGKPPRTPSILRSRNAGNKRGGGKWTTSKVKFSSIHVREYSRSIGGGGGVPGDGSWSLGLGTLTGEYTVGTVDDFESNRAIELEERKSQIEDPYLRSIANGETRQFSHKSGVGNPLLGRLSEKERKALLKGELDDGPEPEEKGGFDSKEVDLMSIVAEDRKEVNEIRKSRKYKNLGCDCNISYIKRLPTKKLKESLRYHGFEDLGTKHVLQTRYISEVLVVKGTCCDNNCPCYRLGVPCHDVTCLSLTKSKKQKGPELKCGNPNGFYKYDPAVVKAARTPKYTKKRRSTRGTK